MTTPQDLRTAAHLVTTQGHARRDYVSPDGRVCAAGAIGLATGHMQLKQLEDGAWDWVSPNPMNKDSLDRTLRFDAAIEALAPLLPVTPCPGGCYPNDYEVDPSDHHAFVASNAKERVFHFNDFICEGGPELALLLTQAAEKLEADAA